MDHFVVLWDPPSEMFVGVCDGTPLRYYHPDPMVALTGVRVLAAHSRDRGVTVAALVLGASALEA